VDDFVFFDYSPGGGYYSTLEGDVTAMFVLANFWVDVPLGEFIRPYLGGGIGFGRLDVDLSMTGGSTFIDDADWGFAYQAGADVAFDISSNIAIDVGYRYKAIDNTDLNIEAMPFAPGVPLTGTEPDYRSHNVLVGVRFGF
jgi:OOP family OmpA-OmpF porin